MQETISYEDLKHLTDAALEALGLSGTDREIVRDVLLYAELSGNNQGLIKIPQKAVQPSPDATPIVIERPFAAVAHIRGNRSSRHGGHGSRSRRGFRSCNAMRDRPGCHVRHLDLNRRHRLFRKQDCESRQDRGRDVRNAKGRCG